MTPFARNRVAPTSKQTDIVVPWIVSQRICSVMRHGWVKKCHAAWHGVVWRNVVQGISAEHLPDSPLHIAVEAWAVSGPSQRPHRRPTVKSRARGTKLLNREQAANSSLRSTKSETRCSVADCGVW
jgi:hypothetical protein